jgi:hypothetical protein
MSKANWMTTAGGLLLAVALAVGCKRNSDGPAASVAKDDDVHVEHQHPTEGRYGGTLIELGNEEYHAELVHDEKTGTVTIYILDAHAEFAVPIDATELTINLKHDGQAEQFKLAASPIAGDAPGKSSRFVSSDAELLDDLAHERADPQLVVTISGKQYRGKLDHVHEE